MVVGLLLRPFNASLPDEFGADVLGEQRRECDKRTPSHAEALSWRADLGDITRDEAVDAVREHFRTRPDTNLAVGHVIAAVKRHRHVGLDQAHRVESVMLRDVDPDDVRGYLNTIHRARAEKSVRRQPQDPEALGAALPRFPRR